MFPRWLFAAQLLTAADHLKPNQKTFYKASIQAPAQGDAGTVSEERGSRTASSGAGAGGAR
jgi:hypothetical protein